MSIGDSSQGSTWKDMNVCESTQRCSTRHPDIATSVDDNGFKILSKLGAKLGFIREKNSICLQSKEHMDASILSNPFYNASEQNRNGRFFVIQNKTQKVSEQVSE
ncbi:hypothetical protein AVEN_16813-1 [Araneus ventricosus]|uniref:Uncharacterized protein n=1 Tax=Araneus ventricosus TaxID=182803 RepID=A0A4Y2BQS1_ARAVE|nr:hypothetical protein AVEN_16813-1 [Araneus ventricosus]